MCIEINRESHKFLVIHRTINGYTSIPTLVSTRMNFGHMGVMPGARQIPNLENRKAKSLAHIGSLQRKSLDIDLLILFLCFSYKIANKNDCWLFILLGFPLPPLFFKNLFLCHTYHFIVIFFLTKLFS